MRYYCLVHTTSGKYFKKLILSDLRERGFGSQHIADEEELNVTFRSKYFPFTINLKSEI